ncbi:hypothetical protein PS3_15074 [Limosilactobacillus gastricus PS3]|uniref:bis(5'-nucleosyl)-tetraphosphatase (symmetrical) n=1 Tax=Limosilactobacillus gastricus PS3 TaxID=1144300 RepID=H4GI64_9LACO|nr:bis(5'-nucleosyl)-tetraphosphatase (symmetrical) YqeK [Limosilactobacillus gastricus]EHS87403.1 hypothetical protein PS3_15074 [Limosilactobacillus gastricus PS3]
MTNNDQQFKYTGEFAYLDRDQLVTKIQAALSPERFKHVLRVETTARQLARQYGVDEQLASIAGLCHDYAKERPAEDFIQVIKAKQLEPDLLSAGNAIWHGVVGAEMVADELLVHDQRILDAIRQHTFGGPVMTKLSQVLYMADYIEPGRDFPGVDQARQITQQSLAKGVAFQTWHTLNYLVQKGASVYPATIDTYNAWVPQYRKEFLLDE